MKLFFENSHTLCLERQGWVPSVDERMNASLIVTAEPVKRAATSLVVAMRRYL